MNLAERLAIPAPLAPPEFSGGGMAAKIRFADKPAPQPTPPTDTPTAADRFAEIDRRIIAFEAQLPGPAKQYGGLASKIRFPTAMPLQ